MFFNEKNEDEDKKNETLRQTLERVMREKGMSKEPQVMHTEIGDFTYYNDNKTDNSGSTAPAGTTPTGLNQPTNLSGTNTASGVSSFNTSDTFNTTQRQTPTPWSNSTTSQPTIPYSNGQQLRMPSGSQYQVTIPSDELQQKLQQPSTWDKVKNAANNFAGGTEAFSVGYATGATLGNFDEGMGAATAAITLNPNNYAMGRDATRQLQNNLQQQHPIAYGVGEFTGAMTTPMHLAKGDNFKQKAFNAFTDTINASAGYAENWNDFGTNLVANGAANIIGLKAEQLPLWRASARPLVQFGKKFIKQGINSSADNAKNLFYKKDDEDEEYYY